MALNHDHFEATHGLKSSTMAALANCIVDTTIHTYMSTFHAG